MAMSPAIKAYSSVSIPLSSFSKFLRWFIPTSSSGDSQAHSGAPPGYASHIFAKPAFVSALAQLVVAAATSLLKRLVFQLLL